jgi:hypothetical protein
LPVVDSAKGLADIQKTVSQTPKPSPVCRKAIAETAYLLGDSPKGLPVMSHKSVKTAMIYTHLLNRGAEGCRARWTCSTYKRHAGDLSSIDRAHMPARGWAL